MKIILSLKKLTERQRLLVLLAIVVSATIIMLLLTRTSEKVAVAPRIPTKKESQVSSIPIKPALRTEKLVTSAQNSTRDPFAIPPEFRGQKDQPVPSVIPEKILPIATPEKNKITNPKESFRLTGIIAAADKRLAIIKSANKSKAYQLDECIGNYQLTVINEASVILTGTGQDLVLRLETSQERGTTSEK